MTFTFIVEFRGGTYCSQIESDSVISALPKWIDKLKSDKSEIKYLGDKVLDRIENAISEESNRPIKLKGLKNVWFTMLTSNQGTFSINIVQTESK